MILKSLAGNGFKAFEVLICIVIERSKRLKNNC